MRKTLAVLLSALALTFGAPIVGLAQAPTSTLRGQIVDAGGRGATGMRVEVVKESFVVATTISTTDGHFSIAGLPAGNYVVRTTANGQPTGVRVTVQSGQASATALLVLPSVAKASPAAIIAIVGPALASAIVSVAIVAVAEATVQSQSTADNTFLQQNVAAANQLIQQFNQQVAASNPGAPQVPIFTFIPFVPLPAAS